MNLYNDLLLLNLKLKRQH